MRKPNQFWMLWDDVGKWGVIHAYEKRPILFTTRSQAAAFRKLYSPNHDSTKPVKVSVVPGWIDA